jgi:hypothetical protein
MKAKVSGNASFARLAHRTPITARNEQVVRRNDRTGSSVHGTVSSRREFSAMQVHAPTAVPQLLYSGPQPPSGFFIKKKPPCKTLEWARELWNRSSQVESAIEE